MKTYIYPDNLRASVKLWFWSVRDFIIICAGITFQTFANTVTEMIIPAQMIMKSLTDQNHSFTLALRFSG